MNPRDTLKSTSFFSDVLDDREIDMLSSHAHFVRYPRGATPIEEDGPGHSMFVVVSGEAAVTVSGDPDPIARLKAGDIFGEMSLLTGARRSATVTAVTDLETVEVSKDALAKVLDHSPDLVDRFVQMLSRRQRELDHAAGGNAWGMMRLGKLELTSMIQSFFRRAQ